MTLLPGDMVKIKSRRGHARHVYWAVASIKGAKVMLERWARGERIAAQSVTDDLEFVAGPPQ